MAHFQDSIEMRRKRANVVTKMNELMDRVKEEKRSLGKDEEQQWDRMVKEEEELRSTIDKLEKLEDANKSLEGHENRFAAYQKEDMEQGKKGQEYRDVFKKWIMGGTEMLGQEERSILFANRSQDQETRALSVGTNTAGGYTVPQGFYDSLIEAMKWFGGVRDVANVFSTDSGNALPIPTVNDTANVGAILAENAAASNLDVPFGQTILNAYKYTSNIVLVSMELLQDSAFDIEQYLAKALGTRIARINNTHFTTGTGSSQPQGVVTGAALGKTGLTGQTTSVIFDDIVDLEHSVDIAYRNNAKFMMHDSTLKALKKLKDSQGRPLFLPGIAYKEPDSLNGFSYVVNNDMPVMAANAKSILFGDFSNYWVRDVKAVQVVRFNEKFMDSGQVGFVAFSRADGKLVDAGNHPIAYYANSAT
jgi:HK97 family phage major capsid protein